MVVCVCHLKHDYFIAYRARPKISLTRNWGQDEHEAREGLADVIKIHEMLTNQILTGRFLLVIHCLRFVVSYGGAIQVRASPASSTTLVYLRNNDYM